MKKIILLIPLLLLIGCFGPSGDQLSVSVNDPVRIGYVDILVESSGDLENLAVSVGGLPAEHVSTEGSMHKFKYFVSPYSTRDPLGVQKVEAVASASNGQPVKASAELNISYFAIGEKFDGVTYYYFAEPPSPTNLNPEYAFPDDVLRKIVFEGENVNFFFELDEGESDRNAEIINTFQSLIVAVTSKGQDITSYGVEVKDGQWVNCIDTEMEHVDLSDCERIANNEHSIVLKLPDYPTTQIYIHGNAVELQPTDGQVVLVIGSFVKTITQTSSF
ncbi:hypothetical protein K8R43_01510 [archaeon]|nr:hypothetical protein [archaeon]